MPLHLPPIFGGLAGAFLGPHHEPAREVEHVDLDTGKNEFWPVAGDTPGDHGTATASHGAPVAGDEASFLQLDSARDFLSAVRPGPEKLPLAVACGIAATTFATTLGSVIHLATQHHKAKYENGAAVTFTTSGPLPKKEEAPAAVEKC